MSVIFKDVNYVYYPKSPYEHKALFDIDLEIKDKSFTAIIGHTGSGKSTLVQQINALLLPTSGEIAVGEYKINANSKIVGIKNLRKHAGMVFQFPEYQLFEETCFKDIAFGPKNYGIKEEDFKEEAGKLLKLVGLDETYLERSPFEISGGQKRRVAIAGILALDPDVLILDEPTAGLDPKGTSDMMDLFHKLNKLGKTIILVTHDMNLVLKYSTDIVVLSAGKIVFEGKSYELFKDEEHCYELNIDVPNCIKFANRLNKRNYNIDISLVKDEESLANEIIAKRK